MGGSYLKVSDIDPGGLGVCDVPANFSSSCRRLCSSECFLMFSFTALIINALFFMTPLLLCQVTRVAVSHGDSIMNESNVML